MTTVTAAFDNPVHDAQRTFRCALDAMARPTIWHMLPVVPQPLPGLGVSATALALTLLDHEVTAWLRLVPAPPVPACASPAAWPSRTRRDEPISPSSPPPNSAPYPRSPPAPKRRRRHPPRWFWKWTATTVIAV
ncbi:MAG: phosphonate C-P lyase system protein PhnH [Arhodomonas sp.]|nr:phosphonate C-P lyase system protein PhnH [Arhodomonas sp.]